ncbi:peptidoglycan DD-metalloendopeptidase family protein [Vibrio brasiliensis]|jgi:murein DD-endopeptidase MepM/ murein hydrolase activator NlpD|uniref:peptidoglycan DD-metalloendopeptidase family protein n=1 Tax=Vibrio brasiliensis TaxID=170652 RepID=UPI001EFE00A9|nr:peptidoglycan DD-metalloendopeptidase family protein [Vibrio brasiliensis]MCG9784079.1 peptidoglycan DD-metalloendopeptidase family protein [Vibrio brasiliensis]
MVKFRIIAVAIATISLSMAFFIPSSNEQENIVANEPLSQLEQISVPADVEQVAPPKTARIHYIVKVGDSLSEIFSQLEIPYRTLQEILAVDSDHLKLDMIKPGEQLEFVIDDTGQLLSLDYHLSLVERAIYSREAQGNYVYRFEEIPGEWRETLYSGQVVGSFSLSAHRIGLSSNQIASITRVLRDKIDFTRSLRAGDQFDILVKQQYLADHPTGNSEIKAISFKLAKGEVSAFLAKDGRFYDREGNSLERAFNRYPVDKQYRRITSAFNPKRKHPVTGRITPHNGTDFATPVGAPVYSTGDGKVLALRNHPYAGKYIVIEHNSVYKTRYLHLSKFLVKRGQTVKRGQKIAISGATGRLTGPHLHFEVLVRNRPVDAMKADLPIARSLPTKDKGSFLARISEFDSLVSERNKEV